VRKFICEDDLNTFEGWLNYQQIDTATSSPEELGAWRRTFDEVRSSADPKVGLMKLRSVVGEYRYAAAVRDGSHLWLTLWVRRSRKGDFFVMAPRRDSHWDVHTSYHQNGTLHKKSYGHKTVETNCQPLRGVFRGTQSLGAYGGHAPKDIGAICDPTAFSGVVEVAPGVLGPIHGTVTVDLAEPGCDPTRVLSFSRIVQREVFRDFVPWVVITIWAGLDELGSESKSLGSETF
jgi:hypothetical protein